MKLWNKGKPSPEAVDTFTAGKDRVLDNRLAKYDITGSIAHAKMLAAVGILTDAEAGKLTVELKSILQKAESGSFTIPAEFEDIHSCLEFLLTERLGNLGKKIHTGRSRNDQVLLDLHLYLKEELKAIEQQIVELFELLMELAERHQNDLLPGYTHLQIAMPSSFGLWFSAYAELLLDDLVWLDAAFKIADQNPLGSAAGYGSSFPLNRKLTTELLGFSTLKYNSIAAQLSRGRLEKGVAVAVSSVAGTLAKLSMDVVLYTSQNFGFISFPDELTTGSSIMPHKKNPDVFELIRAKCNKIQALPSEISLILSNLPSGYHRDFQLLKESLFTSVDDTKDCLRMSVFMLRNIRVNPDILTDEKYKYLYSVEVVAKLVQEGKSFREAYREVGASIDKGIFETPGNVRYTHEGSIGNLCLDEIRAKLKR
ncbi:MAG: argininosuccinate lyase [Saprospiraceae bacterium]